MLNAGSECASAVMAITEQAPAGPRDGPGLSANRPVAGGGCLWVRRRGAGLADPRTLTAQLLETRVDRRKIVGSSRTRAFATQLVDASADHRKIISSSGSGHISSPLSVAWGSWAIRVFNTAISDLL